MSREDYELIHASVALDARKAIEAAESEASPHIEWILSNLKFIKYSGKVEVVFDQGWVVSARRVEE